MKIGDKIKLRKGRDFVHKGARKILSDNKNEISVETFLRYREVHIDNYENKFEIEDFFYDNDFNLFYLIKTNKKVYFDNESHDEVTLVYSEDIE
jgi:hypothetical protein